MTLGIHDESTFFQQLAFTESIKLLLRIYDKK